MPPRVSRANVWPGGPFLFGSPAHNVHMQHIARALHEADALYAFETVGVDRVRVPPLRWARDLACAASPAIRRQLSRRAVTEVPADVVRAHWGWEVPRVAASLLPAAERLEDWLWERGEHAFDRACAAQLHRQEIGGFIGIEHSCLRSLRTARSLGKPGVVVYLSPHHRTRARWVDREFQDVPDLISPARQRIERLAAARDARRDEEAATADWIETGSSFTTRSLIDAGVPAGRILTVPMGGSDPVDARLLPARAPSVCRVVAVGPVSVRKGAHHLLRAWPRVAGPGAELHFYGKLLLADRVRRSLTEGSAGDQVRFHGSVPAASLCDVYLQASVLVLPSLCDGFGLVVSEALAHGLPVITTTNTGAADLIEHGRTGFVIPPADEDALANALQWCVDHPEDLFAMRQAALASAGRWTWADFRRRQVELLGRALARQGQPAGVSELRAYRVGA
jgi:glycosyltransferase involved in cell wall biosynthesis